MVDDVSVPRTVLHRHFRRAVEDPSCEIKPVAGGFSGSSVFRVDWSAASFCLRRWPPLQSSSRRILAIHQLLELMTARDVAAVPAPLRSTSGSTLPEVDGAFWQLEPWQPGVADFRLKPTDDRLKSAMNHLAKLHNAVRDWVPPVGVQRWFRPLDVAPSPTIAERIRMIDGYEGSVFDFEAAIVREPDQAFRELGSRVTCLFRLAKDSVLKELRAVVDLCVPNQPCIRDLWHDHLLFSGDKLTGIVDFGAMATDSVMCDLSRLLGSLFGDDMGQWQRAISHYETTRPLTEDEHRLLRPLDRSSVLLSGMTWLKRRYTLRNTPENLSPVCARMETIVARLTTLAETLNS
jgi:Ser/Thr protein kinase RdoA (MazF antagonist)